MAMKMLRRSYVGALAVLAMALVPAAASAATNNYLPAGSGMADGAVAKTTDGWKPRVLNGYNIPNSCDLYLTMYVYDGSYAGTWTGNFCVGTSYTKTDASLGYSGYSTRHTCTNWSGGYRTNLSCWSIT